MYNVIMVVVVEYVKVKGDVVFVSVVNDVYEVGMDEDFVIVLEYGMFLIVGMVRILILLC